MALRSKKGRKDRKDAIKKASSLTSQKRERRVRRTAAETPVAMARELAGKDMVEEKQETPARLRKIEETVSPPPVPVEEKQDEAPDAQTDFRVQNHELQDKQQHTEQIYCQLQPCFESLIQVEKRQNDI